MSRRSATGDSVAAKANAQAKASTVLPGADETNDDLSLLDDVVTDDASLPTVSKAFYHFIAEQGQGGLGRVLRARDKRTQRIVAVKEVKDPDLKIARARLAREALITANLQHPSIVPVYEVGRWFDGEPFYSMKLVEGHTLRDAIRDTETTGERLGLLHHVTAVAEALAYAHSKGVVHRDLKPANILVGPFGETVVIDWGLARAAGLPHDEGDDVADLSTLSPELTRAGSVLGTPAYMAPEQARGQECDERSDVYALGAVLYHLLTGEAPYAHSESVVDDLLVGPPRALTHLSPGLPADLVTIVSRAMEREPHNRYADANELAIELRRFETGKLVAAHDYTIGQLFRRWIRANRTLVLVATVLCLALAASAIVGVARIRNERDLANDQRLKAIAAQASEREAKEETREHLADVHHELGRRELAADRPFRAIAHLSEAATLEGRVSSAISFTAGVALQAMMGSELALPAVSQTVDVGQSQNRKWAGIATADGNLELWDLELGKPTATLSAGNQVFDIEIGNDAENIWVATEGGIVQFEDGAESGRIDGAYNRMVMTSDAKTVFAARDDGRVEERAWPNGDLRRSWPGSDGKSIGSFALAKSDTRIIALADDRSDGRLFDARGKLIKNLGPSIYVAVSPDGDEFALARQDKVTIHNAQSGRQTREVEFPAVANGLLYVSDEKLLISGSGQARLLATATGGEDELPGHNASTAPMPATNNAGIFVTSTGRGRLALWHTSGDRVGSMRFVDGFAIGTLMSGQGDVLAVTRDGQRFYWRHDRAQSSPALVGHNGLTRRLAFSQSGALVATGSEDKTARLWDAATSEPKGTLEGHSDRVTWVEFSPDDRFLASADGAGLVNIWDVADRSLLATLRGHEKDIQEARWSADGQFLASTGADGSTRIWDTATWTQRCSAQAKRVMRGLLITNASDTVITFGEGNATAIRASNCDLSREFKTGQALTVRGALSKNDRYLVLLGSAERETPERAALLFDLEGGAEGTALPGYSTLAAAVALSPDGKRVAIGDMGGRLAEWDLASGEMTASFEGIEDVIGVATYARDGHYLLLGTGEGRLVTFDTRTQMALESRAVHPTGIYFIRLHPNDGSVATAALDPVPRINALPTFSGTAEELIRIARCESPWTIGSRRRLQEQATTCPEADNP